METVTTFRYQTEEEYVKAMTALIKSQNEILLEPDDACDKEYEALAEEYIMFCDAKENGD